MNKKLFVANISWSMTEQQLLAAFQPYGNVIEAIIMMDRETNRSRGFGFVTFDNPVDASKAKTEMNGQEFNGRKLAVDFAREKTFNRDNNRASSRY